MNLLLTILLLSLLGIVVGVLLAAVTKKCRSGPLDSVEKLSEAELRRLTQLKSQLDSGLITREEYQAEREKLLRT